MMRVAVLPALFIVFAVSTVPGSCLHRAPTFRINLETRPYHRWDQILKQYDMAKFKEIITDIVERFIPKKYFPLLKKLDEFMPEPYACEMRGIAKTAGLDLGKVIGLNIVYDITAFCTSIVAQDTRGAIWHGRNLDYKVTELKNLTVVVDYYKNGMAAYTTTSFLGQVGAFTGMRPHAFTVSFNERDQGSFKKNLEALLEALFLKKGRLTSFILRDALNLTSNFHGAVYALTTANLVAPVYLILGGINPGEGVVITRNQTYADVWHLDARSGRWWLLETNYDHWLPPPHGDDRRDVGNRAMEKVGPERINELTMFEVLSIKPVLNARTVFTCLMSAAMPEIYNTEIRD